jgi:hypothetical protein
VITPRVSKTAPEPFIISQVSMDNTVSECIILLSQVSMATLVFLQSASFLPGKVFSLFLVCLLELAYGEKYLWMSSALSLLCCGICSPYGVWCPRVFETLVASWCLLFWNFGFR